jgi:NADH dehydrogenase FAD-containing subunit
MANAVIIGGGFGGVMAEEALAQLLSNDRIAAKATLIKEGDTKTFLRHSVCSYFRRRIYQSRGNNNANRDSRKNHRSP